MGIDDDIVVPKWVFTASASLLVLFVALTIGMWNVNSAVDTGPPPEIISGRPTLVVFDDPGCGWCKRFKRDIAPAYEESPVSRRAPLRYVMIKDQGNTPYRLKWRVSGTPTSVLVDTRGREIGRIGGYPGGGAKSFLSQVEDLLAKVPKEPTGS